MDGARSCRRMMEELEWRILWECACDLARERFYVERADGSLSEEPAFIIVDWFPLVKYKRYALYLYEVGLIDSFTSLAKALRRVKQLVEHANYPIRVFRDRKALQPFAVNEEWRIDVSKLREGAFVKAFNIPEWEAGGIK